MMNSFYERTRGVSNFLIPILGVQALKNANLETLTGKESARPSSNNLTSYVKESLLSNSVFLSAFENFEKNDVENSNVNLSKQLKLCNSECESYHVDGSVMNRNIAISGSGSGINDTLSKNKQILAYKKFLLDMPEHVFSLFLKNELNLIEKFLKTNPGLQNTSTLDGIPVLVNIDCGYAINLENVLQNEEFNCLSSDIEALGIVPVHRAFLSLYIPVAEAFLAEPKMFARFLNFFEDLALLDPKINSLLLDYVIDFPFSSTPKHIGASVLGSAQILIDSMSSSACIDFIKRRSLFSHTEVFEDLILTVKSYVHGNFRGVLKEKETLLLKVFTHLIDLNKQGELSDKSFKENVFQSSGWIKQKQE